MFFGTTPQIVSKFIYGEIKKHQPKRVFVLFAGNFVIEQLTGLVDKSIEVHSTDVSLYSVAIGNAFANKKGIALSEEAIKIFPELAKKTSPLEIGAIAVFMAEVARNLDKDKIPYYKNLNDMVKHDYVKYVETLENKIKTFKGNLGNINFYGTDACEVIKNVQQGDLVFYDPPVLLGDYEKMFKPMEKFFTWTEPTYSQMTDEVKQNDLQMLHNIGAIVYYRRNDIIAPPENYQEVFRYQYKWEGHYTIYSNNNKEKFVGRFVPLREKLMNYKFMSKDDIITTKSKIKFEMVEGTVVNHYRLLWIGKAKMTSMGFNYLIFCDEKLIGLFCGDSGLKFGSNLCLILSDPCVTGTRYKRLSKLILYLILNKEVLRMVNNHTMWEHEGFTTRVFSNEPVSMKYRGLMDIAKRKEEKIGYKYNIIYHKKDKMINTIKEGLHLWLQKYGQSGQ